MWHLWVFLVLDWWPACWLAAVHCGQPRWRRQPGVPDKSHYLLRSDGVFGLSNRRRVQRSPLEATARAAWADLLVRFEGVLRTMTRVARRDGRALVYARDDVVFEHQ